MTIDSLLERQSARNELLSSLLARCPMNVNAIGSQRSFIMAKRGEGVPIISLKVRISPDKDQKTGSLTTLNLC